MERIAQRKEEQLIGQQQRVKEETQKIMERYTPDGYLNKEQLRLCLNDVIVEELVDMELLIDKNPSVGMMVALEKEREGSDDQLPKLRWVPEAVSDAVLEYVVRGVDNGGDEPEKIQYDEVHSAIEMFAEFLWSLPKFRKDLEKLGVSGDTFSKPEVMKFMDSLHLAGEKAETEESAGKLIATFNKIDAGDSFTMDDLYFFRNFYNLVLQKRRKEEKLKKKSTMCSIL
jgi:hypothetical protein